MSGSAIKVVCRFRPQNRIENDNNGHPIVSFSEDNVTVSLEVPVFSNGLRALTRHAAALKGAADVQL